MATRHGTVVAGATETVDLGSDFNEVEVMNRGSGTLWVEVDPTDEDALVAEADDLEVVPANSAATFPSRSRANSTIKVMAEGADVAYSVRGA